jgi:hypothetical protein
MTFVLGWILNPSAPQNDRSLLSSPSILTQMEQAGAQSADRGGAIVVDPSVVGDQMTSGNMQAAMAAYQAERDPLKRATIFAGLLERLGYDSLLHKLTCFPLSVQAVQPIGSLQ